MKYPIYSYLLLLYALLLGQGVQAQTATDSYLDISNHASIGTAGFSSNVDNLYDYDTNSNTLVISAYGAYQSVSKQKWITQTSAGSSPRTWDATGVFKGSSYYHTSTTARCAGMRSDRHLYFNVTNVTSVSALVKSGGTIRSAVLNVYEGDATTPMGSASDATNTVTAITVSGLDATKTYKVELTGSDSSNNSDIYEVAFTGSTSSGGGGDDPSEELTAVTSHTWNFSDFDITTYPQSSTESIVNNLGILPSAKEIVIEANGKTIDGYTFTQRLKLGGTGSATAQNVHFKIAGSCAITVYGMSGSSTATRSMGLTIDGSEVATYSNDGLAIGKLEYTYTGGAADVFVYSKNSGFNLYAIVVEAIVEKENVSLYFDDGLTTSIAVGASATNAAVSSPQVSPITYASSNTNVATVDNNGVVTGVAEGEATITATFAGNDQYNSATDSYTLTVTPAVAPTTLTAVSNKVWTFNNWEAETLEATIINDNIEVAASSSKTVQIKSQSGTADNIAFTKAADMKGAGSSEGRYLHFMVEGGTTVTVYGTTGKNGTERIINIATGTIDNVVGTIPSSSTSTIASGSISCDEATDVYVYSAGSGMLIYGIKVEKSGSQGGETDETVTTPAETGETLTDEVSHTTSQNSAANQLRVELTDGNINYYNTSDVANVTADRELGIVRVTLRNGGEDVYYATVRNLSFAKAVEDDPTPQLSGNLTITESKGWYESAYVKFTPVSGATSYNVYVKGEQYSSYTKIDAELVRNYGSYGRADAVGLKSGTYSMKVIAVVNGSESSTYGEATGLTVRNYQREGFAHKGYSGIGAYNDDGTLKSNAKVLYVTKETAKTITTTVVTSNKGATTTCTGIQTIIDAYQKGYDTTPIAFRFIGLIERSDLDHISSSAEGLQIKGNNSYSELNMTFEGIGDDATTRGFGIFMRNAKSVELRNFANILCMDDAISLDTDNSHVWVHHLDLFYGQPGSSADQKKGDGTVDLKGDTQYVTIDHCHFWDSGKSSLCGMKSESGPNYISYHHNWYDHSDSRHPRIRTMSVHVWNNYFDGNSKYGVGVTYGASAFVERNYFRNTKCPMLSSKQGTDALSAKGTFSGENGGIIKSFGNVMTGTSTSTYIPHTQNSTSFDAYEATSLTETVPSSYKAVAGGTTYNNFDTNSSLMYSYTADRASDVPSVVTGYWGAGRMNHGDLQWTFNNSTEDTNYEIINELKSALTNYNTTLVGGF